MDGELLNPTRILHSIGVTDSSVIADFGCGPGIFAIPAAQITAAPVYCFDVLTTALESVETRASTLNMVNVHAARKNLEARNGSGLDDHSTDFVIMRKILCSHQNNKNFFTEAYRILRSGGKVLVIGWTPEAAIGPAPESRLPKANVIEFATETGFSEIIEIPVEGEHFAITFIK